MAQNNSNAESKKTGIKQSQKAGDNSQQIQADTVIYQTGISEQRVREIFAEMSEQAIAENTEEAHEVATQRINQLEDQLIPRLQTIENEFQSFSDPAFQVLLRKAQLAAACSERQDDYKILAELLLHREKNKASIKKKASISKAVEIVDQIDDDSLVALTMFLMMENFRPMSGNILEGLNVISNLYGKINLQTLPNDELWIDNLSILGAITTSHIGKLKKFEDYFSENLSGYMCVGLKKDSHEYAQALKLMGACNMGPGVFDNNILIDGYVRLPVASRDGISELLMDSIVNVDGNMEYRKAPISVERIACLEKVFDMYSKDKDALTRAKSNFSKLLHSFEPIHTAIEWWNSIPYAISLTSVGRAIGHTNAKSIDSTLPDLD